MGDGFYRNFIGKFIKSRREEGISPYAAKEELLHALRTMQKLQPQDSSIIFHHIAILESINIPEDSPKKSYSDLSKHKWMDIGHKAKKKYIVLFQGNMKGSKKDVKSIAFGPFAGQIADWKMHLLKNRVNKISHSLLYRSESVVMCSPKGTTFHFKSSSTRSKVPTFGFILFDEDNMPEDDKMEYKEAADLKRWDYFIKAGMNKHWRFDYISKIINSFVAYH